MAKPKEEQVKAIKSEAITAADLEGKYQSTKMGTELKIQIAGVRKVTEPNSKLNLFEENYRYEIDTTDEKIVTVGSWSFWNALRKALDEALKAGTIDAIEGTTVLIKHPGEKDYQVEVVQ